MKELGLHQIRKEFLEFFKEKNHLIKKSYSLVPQNDKSLLLINAGMAPLKPYFLGTEIPSNRRMTTSQKCIRTGDIDSVGKTARHGTFFEMLGNFSFGDYFKEESIEWAWEFLTKNLEIDKEILWVSVYYEDDESFKIWEEKIGVSKDRIVKLGKEDNFWELEVGPCGPCSEIYIDRGKEYSCLNPDCKPGCDCDRYMEVWNLVFSQYDKDDKGNYNLLDKPNIDTGMGLERIATILQKKDNIFEIDVLEEIIKKIEKMTNKNYTKDNPKESQSFRVITDHIRAATFLISDGVRPSNEGRGYVLRRIIRRASRHGKLLGLDKLFLSELAKEVINSWEIEYSELEENSKVIYDVLEMEEKKFQETIDSGNEILEKYIKEIKENNSKILSGENAFKLYDTYGFPLDLTKEILEDHKLEVDEESFKIEMEKQRERARLARSKEDLAGWNNENILDIDKSLKSEFVGYHSVNEEGIVTAIYTEDGSIQNAKIGDKGVLVLDNTPFYPEGGGQKGDIGTISGEKTFIKIVGTTKSDNNVILHHFEVEEGSFNIGDKLFAEVNEECRMGASRNHTATHLLHQSLKDVLGNDVNQAGSLVTTDRLRFDFTYPKGLTTREISDIEDKVNTLILKGLNVQTLETSLDDARSKGAQALFGEKYGEKVRMVSISDYSKELCGGTHVSNINNIGLFRIISETGISSGVRRIEAVTGKEAYRVVREEKQIVDTLKGKFKTSNKEILNKVDSITEKIKSLEKDLEKIKSNLALNNINDIIENKRSINGINVVIEKLESVNGENLRKLGDKIRDNLGSVVVVLASVIDGKIVFVSMTTKDLISKGIHSGNILKEISKITLGSGGGRPDMAQAGGKDVQKLDEALKFGYKVIENQLG